MESDNRPLVGALYARTSHEKDDAFSVASQVKVGLANATAQGIQIPERYVFKEDYTGTVIDRPELNKVRRLMADGKIDVLVIYDIDRLARKKYISEYLLEEEIFGNSIQLYVARKNMFVRNTFSDRVLFGIEGNSAQEERDKVLERTARGRREKLEGNAETPGAWLGQSPVDMYGYEKEGRKRNTRLTIVEREAEVIELIFRLFVIEGWGVEKQIVPHLNANGIPTPSQSKGRKLWNARTTWHHAMVYRILKQTAYTGVFYGFKTIEIDGKTKQRPKEEWIRLDFPELQIIDQDVFDRAQELLAKGRSMNAPKWTHEYLLARRIRCQCGYSVQSRSSKKKDQYGTREYAYYVCYARYERLANNCQIAPVRQEYVDQKVWESIEHLLRDPDNQLRGLKRAQELQQERHQESLINMEDVTRRCQEYVQELDDLYQDYRDRVISKEIYLRRKQPIEERLRAAEEVLKEYQEDLSQKVLSDRDIKGISGELQKLSRLLDELGTLEYKHKRKILELMEVTAEPRIENNEHVLVLRIHEWDFDRIQLGVVTQTA